MEQSRKNYELAKTETIKLIALQKKHLGERHLATLVSQRLLAVIYFRLADYDNAEKLVDDTIKIMVSTVGNEHPDTLIAMNLYATLLRRRDDLFRSEQIFRHLEAVGTKELGDHHPFVMVFRSNVAGCLMRQGKLDQAEPLFKSALLVFESIDPKHELTLVVKSNLAKICYDRKNYKQAIYQYEAMQDSFLGKYGETLDTWIVLSNLARAYEKDNQYNRCIATAQRLIVILKKQPANPRMPRYFLTASELICRCYILQGEFETAIKTVHELSKLFPNGSPMRHHLERLPYLQSGFW
jgi:tetratricopeptide (TPR) repeat protein